jgi:hypothetical protein
MIGTLVACKIQRNLDHLYIASGTATLENSFTFPKTLNVQLSHNPESLHMDIYSREMKSYVYTKIYI